MRKIAASLALVACLATSARADEEPKPGTPEAQKKADALRAEALELNKKPDSDPAKVKELLEKALTFAPEDVQILAFLGTLYEVKLGDSDKALEHYDRVIRSLVGESRPKYRAFKADVMARKANILYAEKHDVKAALDLYQASFETFQLSQTADKVSNLLHRLAGEATEEAKKKEAHEKARQAAEDAYKLLPSCGLSGDAGRFFAAKVRVQLALCLECVGEKEKAARALDGVAARDFEPSVCAYNQALLAALRGKGDEAAEQLRSFMKATRPTAKGRNRLRKFIRNEPDFQAFLKLPAWKELVEDEAEEEKPKGG